MQKLLLSIFFLFTINIITAQSFSLGGGLTLGTQAGVSDDFQEEPGFGINIRGLYKINPNWGVTGGGTYYFPSAPEGFDIITYQFNLNGTYSFVKTNSLDAYALLGMDMAFASATMDGVGEEASNTEYGIELGVGLITRIGIFLEAKVEGAYDQGQFTLGYLYKFN